LNDSHAVAVMTTDVGLGGSVVAIGSAADKSMSRGYVPSAIQTITITDDPGAPGIKNGTPIVVRIPAGFAMTWNETDMTATLGGTAAGKVGAVSYTRANHRLMIAVASDFSAGDTLTISDLSFKNYLDTGNTHLELDFNNDGLADAYDGKTVTIATVFHCGGRNDCYATMAMKQDRGLSIGGAVFMMVRCPPQDIERAFSPVWRVSYIVDGYRGTGGSRRQ